MVPALGIYMPSYIQSILWSCTKTIRNVCNDCIEKKGGPQKQEPNTDEKNITITGYEWNNMKWAMHDDSVGGKEKKRNERVNESPNKFLFFSTQTHINAREHEMKHNNSIFLRECNQTAQINFGFVYLFYIRDSVWFDFHETHSRVIYSRAFSDFNKLHQVQCRCGKATNITSTQCIKISNVKSS